MAGHQTGAAGPPRPPVGGVAQAPPPERRLPVRPGGGAPAAGQRALWWFVGVHRSAGVSTLARWSRETGPGWGADARGCWPDPGRGDSPRLVLVARTHMHGLLRAQDALREYLAGAAPAGLHLLGLVLVADAPGRLPPPLPASVRLLGGLAPHVWRVPWIGSYRFRSPLLPPEPGTVCHYDLADVLAGIRSTIQIEVQGGAL